MIPSRASRMLGAAALALIAGSPTMADDAGWYVGANAGQARARIGDSRIVGGLAAAGIATTGIKDDDRHLGYKLFGGYQFNRYIALEAGYFDLGRFGFTADTVPAAGMTGNTKLRGGNVDAVGTLPLTAKFAAFARVGYDYAYAKDAFVGYGAVVAQVPDRSEHSSNYKFGAGLQYAVTESFGLRAEAERYRVHDGLGNRGDIDLFSAGVVYRFGRSAPPPPPAPAAEPVVASVPEPVPPVPPAPAPVRTHVSFSADSLFDFGKDAVRPAGRQALDEFAAELRGLRFERITITGYSDRIGAHEYNVKLSMRRAAAVKSYLIDSAGIPADKLDARGADGANPVTKPEECQGVKRTPKLIACLQPDRRVEVEVGGTELQSAP